MEVHQRGSAVRPATALFVAALQEREPTSLRSRLFALEREAVLQRPESGSSTGDPIQVAHRPATPPDLP